MNLNTNCSKCYICCLYVVFFFSIQAFHNDIGSSSEHAHNESTISLLNYFAFLGTTSDYENIDYEFIENIIPLAGTLNWASSAWA